MKSDTKHSGMVVSYALMLFYNGWLYPYYRGNVGVWL